MGVRTSTSSREEGSRGSVLVVALVVIGFLLAMGAAFLLLGESRGREATTSARVDAAHALAEAAVGLKVADLMERGPNEDPLSGSTEIGTWEVETTRDPDDPELFRLESTAQVDVASRTVRSVWRRQVLTPPGQPGALVAVPGDPAAGVDANFAGAAFRVDGNDHGTGGLPAPGGPTKLGIVSTTTAGADDVRGALDPVQEPSVQGDGGTPSVDDIDEDEASDEGLTPEDLDELVERLAPIADRSISGTGQTVTGEQLGTAADPEITHVDGSVRFAGGVRGHGVLVVDGALEILGDFEFTGLVLVRGEFATGAGTPSIHGGTIVQGPTGPVSLDLRGNPSLLYSEASLDAVRDLLLERSRTYRAELWTEVE